MTCTLTNPLVKQLRIDICDAEDKLLTLREEMDITEDDHTYDELEAQYESIEHYVM
jgi:uncharacterized Zn finger protein